jgi:hypothetical protein
MKMWFPDTTSDGRLLPRLQISAFGIPQKPLGSARTVYFSAHFCPVAFFHQMIALKITLRVQKCAKNHTFLNSCIIWEAVGLEILFYKP